MCGFAGIVTWDNRHRVHREVLERMSARIAHRGPDGAGLWINHDEEATAERPQVGLVHRRLAIIDLDARANQPFTDGRGRWLAFNGEIYNYRELRRELEGLLPDYRWRTQSDTEVLLASYAAWGEKCVEKLNGMFAFAIWDEGKRELFLARDPMGQKPLYYVLEREENADSGAIRSVVFASEPAALRESSLRSSRPAAFPLPLQEYLCWGYNLLHPISAPRLMEGAALRVRRDGQVRRHYFPHMVRGPRDKERERMTDEERVAGTRELVERSVRMQLVADVPVGCFLSGGIDSSVIAACMKRSVGGGGGQRVLTFSIGFDDPRYDETQYAAEVARHLGTEHHAFIVKPSAIDDLPKLAAVFGEPFADSSALPTHYLARETRKHVKVALSGDGGDELFGGYDRYRALALTERVRRLPDPLRAIVTGRLTRWAARLLPGVHPKSTAMRLKRLVSSFHLPAQAQYASFLRLFDQQTINELLISPSHEKALRINHQEGRFWTYERTRGVVAAALAADRESYLPGDLLTKVDRCSMLHALEVRSPFMDPDLVRFASTLTTPQLLKGGPKRMLREAFANDLPAWVFKRKKMGFAVPIGEWFRSSLRPMLHDHLFAADSFAAGHFNQGVVRRLVEEHETERVDHSQRLYGLLMLELWWRGQR
jgi:asparagine synthase (glutamine-hydrolysing)